MDTLLIVLGAFVIVLAILVIVRAKSGNKFEVKNTDIILALVPIALFLFLTGKIQEFTFGDLKIVAAIQDAAQSPVASQITTLPVETIRTEMKGGTGIIPSLLEKKVQALGFSLGRGGYYYGPAIQEYFQELTKSPSFKYIVINNDDNTFFGMADAQQIGALMKSTSGDEYAYSFERWLDTSDKERLSKLPGFIAQDKALTESTDKQNALKLMDSLDVHTLPVISNKNIFLGIVEREKLTASLLVDIANRIEKK